MSIRKMLLPLFWIGVLLGLPLAQAQVAVSIQQPYYGFALIPSEQIRIFGVVSNGATGNLTWAVTSTSGGASATLTPSLSPNISGSYVDVQLNQVGGTCSISGTSSSNYTLTSHSKLVLTATSVDDATKSASATINICDPPHTVNIIGSYETLFSGQQDELEAKVWGLTNKDVTWTVTQPSGGDATLSELTHPTLAFSATKPGRYTFTACAVADLAQCASAMRYVSGVAYPGMTPSHAIPVDCTVDPQLKGGTYDIGSGKPYATIGAALAAANTSASQPNAANENWVPPGTTFRLWNTDTTGINPSSFHEYLVLAGQGTFDQPNRLLGCADPYGHLPILSMTDAVSVPNNQGATAYIAYGTGNLPYYQIAFFNNGNSYASYPSFGGAKYWNIEGIAFRNGWSDDGQPLASGGTGHTPATTPAFYPPTSSTEYPVGPAVACIRVYAGDQMSFRGNDLQDCAFGILGDFNSNSDWGGFFGDVNVDGNALSAYGDYSVGTHGMYLQGFRQRIWNNWWGPAKPLNNGILLKIRGVDNTVSYNSFQNGTQARVVDFVDDTDSANFMDMNSYLYGYYQTAGSPLYTPDLISGAQEAWLHDYVYGNSFNMAVGPQPPISANLIHYFLDQAGGSDQSSFPYRRGVLNFYHNTVALGSNVATTLFDTNEGGSDRIRTQWPTINNFNNAVYVNPLNVAAAQYFKWSALRSDFLVFGGDWINQRWGTNIQTCVVTNGSCFGTGWSTDVSAVSPYMDAANLPAHLTNFAGLTVGPDSEPFNVLNLTPTRSGGLIGAATASLPAELVSHPVRFMKSTTSYALLPRTDTTTIGAFDYKSDPSQVISIALPTMSASVMLGYTDMPLVTCYYDDGTSQTCSYMTNAYTWSVSDSSVLSVSSTGVVTGLRSGTALVTVTINGMSSSQAVTVKPLVPLFTGKIKIVGARAN